MKEEGNRGGKSVTFIRNFEKKETQIGFFLQSKIQDATHEQDIVKNLGLEQVELERYLVGDFSLESENECHVLKKIMVYLVSDKENPFLDMLY